MAARSLGLPGQPRCSRDDECSNGQSYDESDESLSQGRTLPRMC